MEGDGAGAIDERARPRSSPRSAARSASPARRRRAARWSPTASPAIRAASFRRAASCPPRSGSTCSSAWSRLAAGTVARVGDLAEVPAEVAAFLRRHNLPLTVRRGADPLLGGAAVGARRHARGLDRRTGRMRPRSRRSRMRSARRRRDRHARARLGPDNPTTLNFLPDNHIVVVEAKDVAGDYETVWQRLRGELRRRRDAAHRQPDHRPVALRRHRADADPRRARAAPAACDRGGRGESLKPVVPASSVIASEATQARAKAACLTGVDVPPRRSQ